MAAKTKAPFEASFTESQVSSAFLNSICFHVLAAVCNSVHSLHDDKRLLDELRKEKYGQRRQDC